MVWDCHAPRFGNPPEGMVGNMDTRRLYVHLPKPSTGMASHGTRAKTAGFRKIVVMLGAEVE